MKERILFGNRGCTTYGSININDIRTCEDPGCPNCESVKKAFKEVSESWANEELVKFRNPETEKEWERDFIEESIFCFRGEVVENYIELTLTYEELLEKYKDVLTEEQIKEINGHKKQ